MGVRPGSCLPAMRAHLPPAATSTLPVTLFGVAAVLAWRTQALLVGVGEPRVEFKLPWPVLRLDPWLACGLRQHWVIELGGEGLVTAPRRA